MNGMNEYVPHLGKQKATSTTTNRNLTTLSTAGVVLPITSASSSGRLEDEPRHYQSPSLPFPQTQTQSQPLVSPNPLPQAQLQCQQSQSQPVPEASDPSLFLPQDTVQRVLGSTTPTTTSTTTTTISGGNESVNLRWDGSRPESGESGVEIQHDQSQGTSRQQKMGRREALAQILEYHREGGRARRKNGNDDGVGDECRGRDGDGDGDERGGKRKRRNSDVELDRHGVGKTYTSSQQTFRQPPAASAGPSTSTSSSVPWSSSNNNALSFVPFAEEDECPSPSSSSLMTNVNEGLQVYTVGHLMPRNKFANEGNWSLNANGFNGDASANASSKDLGNFMYEPTVTASETLDQDGDEDEEEEEDVEIVPPGMLITVPPPSTPVISSTTATPLPSPSSVPLPSSPSSSSQQKLRVRRATFVPGGWAVPPRVLLVDDDAVIRKLSSKFLKIFGCTTDVAVDGIGAVTKMNLEKYDLVLMVNFFSSWQRMFG